MLTLRLVSTTAGVVYPILIRQLLPLVGFTWTVRCLAMVVLASNGTSLVLMHPRLRQGMSKPFTFNISIFLDSPYVLFVLGTRFFSYYQLDRTNLTLDDFVLTILPTQQ
jgi:hypothetical protein